jgi:hypothetical protein
MANPKTRAKLLSTDSNTTAFIQCADDLSTNLLLQTLNKNKTFKLINKNET